MNEIKNRKNYLKKAFGNSAWMVFSRVLRIALGIFVNVYVTRYLGPEKKGIMADAAAISGFFGFFSLFGLTDIVLSRFSSEREKSGETAGTSMTIMFLGGIISFVLSIIYAVVLGVSKDIKIYVLIDSLVYLVQCFTVYEYWFYSNSISKNYAITQFCIHLVFTFIRILGVYLKADLLYFVFVTPIESIVILLAAFFCYKKTKCYYQGKFCFNLSLAKNLIHLALPMVVLGFATTIYMKVDQIMVGKMMGNSELGLYSVAVNLAEYWYFVPMTVYSSFLPVLAKKYTENEDFIGGLQKLADLLVVIGLFAAIGVQVFGRWGVELLYGSDFSKTADILMIYIWSGVFTCLSFSGQAYYIVHKDTKTVMWINLFGAIMNFILNIILIHRIGSIGAAIATLLEYMLVAFGQMIVLWKKYNELYIIQLKAFFPFKRLLTIGYGLLSKKR